MLLYINEHPVGPKGVYNEINFYLSSDDPGLFSENKMIFSVLFAVIALATIGTAHIGGQSPYQDVSPHIYCGRNLARALAMLCYDDDGIVNKRSESGMYSSVLIPYYKGHESHPGWPWLAPHMARVMSLPSRGKRFIVNECCDKACTISELLTYC